MGMFHKTLIPALLVTFDVQDLEGLQKVNVEHRL